MDFTQAEKDKLFLILEKIYIAQEEQLRLFRQYDSEYHKDIEIKEGGLGEKFGWKNKKTI